ncbi:Uncharacterised protein [Mycoplasmopsis synoviae]|uniref:Uncharacterized protein n=1 Tax=Mycoplasmopsis synoviae TaxID=2109 RepID=A0A3B0P9Y7_MYCSY|nr:Uncharacterised protein [Mycoplasmopsis synoviae]
MKASRKLLTADASLPKSKRLRQFSNVPLVQVVLNSPLGVSWLKENTSPKNKGI